MSLMSIDISDPVEEFNKQVAKMFSKEPEPRLEVPLSKPEELELPTPRDVGKSLLQLPSTLYQLQLTLDKLSSILGVPEIKPEEERRVVTEERRTARLVKEEVVGASIQEIAKPVAIKKPDFLMQYTPTTKTTVGEVDKLTLSGEAVWMLINNTSRTATLFVSFDGGRNYLTLIPSATLSLPQWYMPPGVRTLHHRSDEASISFEIFSGETEIRS